jgi:acetoin utilization protein AcuB
MRLSDMVAGWMSEHLVTTEPGASATEAIDLMLQHGIRHLPVMDGPRLVGFLSDRDVRGWPAGKVVAMLMTRGPIISIDPAATLGEAATKMIERRINALPVIDQDGALVGIITSYDLLHALAGFPLPASAR